MEHYCHVGDASSILRVFRGMRQSPGVYFDADSYALIVGSLAKAGSFRVDGTTMIEGAKEAGFSSTHGPELFDQIATEMAQDILELSEAAAKAIQAAFVEGFGASEDPRITIDEIPMVSKESVSSSVTVGRVEIDATTALCPASGAKLRLIALDEIQREHVHDTLLEMARLGYQEFTKKQKRKENEDENKGFAELQRFSEWLE
jgi:hypothetical protein